MDTLAIRTWKIDSARRIFTEFVEAFGGDVPADPGEWQQVAARFDKAILFVVCPPLWQGEAWQDCVWVRVTPDKELFLSVLSHELSESVLRSCPDMLNPKPGGGPPTEQDYHEISVMVEHVYAEAQGRELFPVRPAIPKKPEAEPEVTPEAIEDEWDSFADGPFIG